MRRVAVWSDRSNLVYQGCDAGVCLNVAIDISFCRRMESIHSLIF